MSPVDPREPLSRFLFSSNNYRLSDNTVRHSAFMPPEDKRLSVFRTSGLQENEIWRLGDALRAKPPLGRADISALAINKSGLTIVPDDTPPRHANILGWPDEASAIKLKALELADRSHLCLK